MCVSGFALASESTATFLTEAEAHGARTLFSHRVIQLEASGGHITGTLGAERRQATLNSPGHQIYLESNS